MKIKYLVIISLLLAVLTIGAVSASDDANNLTADDAQGDSIQQAPEDDGVLEDLLMIMKNELMFPMR